MYDGLDHRAWAYWLREGTLQYPADKHSMMLPARGYRPPAREQKVPALTRGEAFRWGLVLLPVFAVGAVLRWIGVAGKGRP